MSETPPPVTGGASQSRRMGADTLSPALSLLAILGLGAAQWGLQGVLLPGLNERHIDAWAESLGQVSGSVSLYRATFSIVALGIFPYLVATVSIQVLSSLVRQLGGATVREATTPRVDRAVLAVTLVVALVQAWFITQFLERSGVPGTNQQLVHWPGWSFRVPAVCALVAGVFLLLALARATSRLARVNGVGCLLAIGIVEGLFSDARLATILDSLPTFVLVLAVCSGLSLLLLRTTRLHALRDGRGRTWAAPPSMRIPLGPAGGAPLVIGLLLMAGLQRGSFSDPWLGSFRDADGLPALALLALSSFGLTYAWPALFRIPERVSEGMRAARLFLLGVRPGAETEVRMKAAWMRPTLSGAGILVALALAPVLLPALGMGGLAGLPSVSRGVSILFLMAMVLDVREALRRAPGPLLAPTPLPSGDGTPTASSADGRCSACSVEVADEFAVCWSCGVPVTPIAPLSPQRVLPEAPAGGGAPTTVARMTFPIDAEMARLALEAERIPVRVLDAHLVTANWFLAMAVGGIRVQVPAECAASARELLFPAQDGADRHKGRGSQQGSTP